MNIIKNHVANFLLFVSYFTILIILNSSKALANGEFLPSIGYIDNPMISSTVKGDIDVRGWFLDKSGVSKIEVLVDEESMGEAQYGGYRPDVKNVFPDYENVNSGYQFTLTTKNLTNGQHILIVRETGNNGSTKELQSTVNVQNLPTIGYIDNPTNGSTVKGDIDVRGWFLDRSGVSKIEVLVDGKSMGEAQNGGYRPDVKNVFPDYANVNSGYQFILTTKNLTNGQHILIVRETGNNGSTKELQSTVNVQNLPTIGYIDNPTNGSTVKGDIDVRGWFLDRSGVSKIEVLVDGKSMGEAQNGGYRPDVKNIFPDYENANSGYQFTLITKNLTNGQHLLIVRETGNNGSTKELQSTVNVQNLLTIGYIDNPTNGSTVKGDIDLRGWFLDRSGVSGIEVLVDGRSMGEAQYGGYRPDVKNVFPDYGNANSGYQFTLNSLLLAGGHHTLTVKETGENGTTTTLTTVININNGNPYTHIDLRKPANIIADEIINFFKQKRPDSPLKDYAQSFIDAQNKYGVNAQYLVAHAIWETGWGDSNLRTYKNNLFGYGAYDVCPFTCGYYFPNGGDSINYEAYIVSRDYLNETGSYYNGATLTGINVKYATDPNWANGIAGVMQSIKPFDDAYYLQTGIIPNSTSAAPSFGRNIPSGQPYPTNVIINFANETYATVTTNGLSFRSLPTVSSSTYLKSMSAGTIVNVLGYNTDVKYVAGDVSQYPYDNRWYRVLVNGQEGWLYGGGITFNQ